VNKKGETPIYVSFYIAREKIVLPCKISVSLKAWDTANKNLTTIKIYVRDAFKRGYLNVDPFEELKIKWQRCIPSDYLTEDELKMLTELYSSKTLLDNFQKVLVFFLFMCFTSLHIGDAKAIKMEQISKTTLTYYREKNRNSKPEPVFIPLSEPAKKIIKHEAGLRLKGRLFDGIYTDQIINKYLKKIAKKAGIEKKLKRRQGGIPLLQFFFAVLKIYGAYRN